MKSIVVQTAKGERFTVPAYLIALIYRILNKKTFPERDIPLSHLRNSYPVEGERQDVVLIVGAMRYFGVENFPPEDFQLAVRAIYVKNGPYQWQYLNHLVPDEEDRNWVTNCIANIS